MSGEINEDRESGEPKEGSTTEGGNAEDRDPGEPNPGSMATESAEDVDDYATDSSQAPAESNERDESPAEERSERLRNRRKQSTEKSFTSEQPADMPDEDARAALKKRERRLEEREIGLDTRADELDDREDSLDQRERKLDELKEKLEDKSERLQEREENLNEREADLDSRAETIERKERELEERAAELEEHNESLNRYIHGQVENLESEVTETMIEALDEYEERRHPGRFGTTSTVILGIVGLTLVAGGAGYGASLAVNGSTGLLGSTVLDYALTGGLILFGLLATLVSLIDGN